ncbi:MAG: TraR/DksA C4-type zinc finger protein [Acidimicrobiia bacterium]|nr:TraR/DksA C4-type zinc finger protein [Acidimicrobiia bacterium]MDH4306425.1 TraR/DksA C4-type zinc finger protein [Acidimicrobiia bacterium]MDH5293433.1 TraR/DksA C4-type zinc finger protein [Acidimicrobiia bacterium]
MEQDIAGALTTRRQELTAELERLTAPPAQGAEIGFGKRVGEGTAEAVERLSTTATARSIASSISEIDHALAKLAAGTYGVCDDCGTQIPEERLEARPATPRCIGCANG